MKKIINGLRYDTDKSNPVHAWSNGFPDSDFHHCEEVLYRTDNGRWFLFGEGGALSIYSGKHGNDRTAGRHIEPFTKTQAYEWLEEHDGSKMIEKHFPGSIADA